MALLKKVVDGMLYKGGMLGTGILGVLLWKGRYLPEYTGVISFGAMSVGFCGSIWNIWKAEGKKEESSTDKCEEIIGALYREMISNLERRISQQAIAPVTEGEEGGRQTLDRREQGSHQFADDGKSSKEMITLFKSPEKESQVPRNSSFIKECGEILRKREISRDRELNVGGRNEHAVNSSEVVILADEVDEAVFRELTLNELELLTETGEMDIDVLKKEQEAKNHTYDNCTGEVFQASQLFKNWDTQRPKIEKELTSLVRRGNGVNLGKPTKGGNTKSSFTKKRKNK